MCHELSNTAPQPKAAATAGVITKARREVLFIPLSRRFRGGAIERLSAKCHLEQLGRIIKQFFGLLEGSLYKSRGHEVTIV